MTKYEPNTFDTNDLGSLIEDASFPRWLFPNSLYSRFATITTAAVFGVRAPKQLKVPAAPPTD